MKMIKALIGAIFFTAAGRAFAEPLSEFNEKFIGEQKALVSLEEALNPPPADDHSGRYLSHNHGYRCAIGDGPRKWHWWHHAQWCNGCRGDIWFIAVDSGNGHWGWVTKRRNPGGGNVRCHWNQGFGIGSDCKLSFFRSL